MKPNKFYALETDGRNADIMIYGDITSYPWMESDVSAYNLSKQIADLDVDTITVGINSYGGEVAEGLAIYNALRNHKAKVITRCDGFACSVASVIFAAGDERIMNESSMLMIHNAWTYAEGNAAELRKQADDLDKVNAASIKAYQAIVSIEPDELQALLDDESWISPEQAVNIGLATGIIRNKRAEKPTQSVRRMVYDMIINPYKMADRDGDGVDDDTGEPVEPETDDTADDTDTTDTSTGTDDTGTSDTSDTGTTDTGDTSDDTTDDEPDEDQQQSDDKRKRCMEQFINAIFK